jgi:N-acetylneuraminic acid mutarotase
VAPLPVELSDAAGAVDGMGNFYVAGGLRSSDAAASDVLFFDRAANRWQRIGPMPGAVGLRAGPGAAFFHGAFFAIGGSSQPDVPAVTYYDDVSAYAAGPTPGWQVRPALPAPARAQVVSLVLGDAVWLLGGESSAGAIDHVDSFDGVNWSSAPSLPGPLGRACGVVLAGKVYLLGGYTGSIGNPSLYVYDGSGWHADADAIPEPRWACAAAAVQGAFYVFGGYWQDGQTQSGRSSVYRYDPAAAGATHWAAMPSLPAPRVAPLALPGPDDRIYVMGGADAPQTPGQVLVFEPGTASWLF